MKKILLVLVVLVVAFGAFILLGNKKMSPTKSIQESESTSMEKNTPTQVQPPKENVTVTLTDTGFVPKDITVKAGTRVVWINKSGVTATVSSDDHPTHRLYPFLNLGEFADGSSVQVVADQPGKYSYHNHNNATQTGIVTVE